MYRFLNRREGSGNEIMGYAGENLPARNLVYFDNVSLWRLADADVVARSPVIGLTIDPINTGDRGRILLHGMIGLATWTWIPGSMLYASENPGQITQTAPANTQEVGVAYEADVIYFNPGLRAYGSGIVEGASIVVNTDGVTTWAMDGETGRTLYGGPTDSGGVVGTNAAAVIQAAIIAVGEVAGGGMIHLKAGIYNLTQTIQMRRGIEFSQPTRLALVGSGRFNTILDNSVNTGNPAINLQGIDGNISLGQILMRNFQIRGGTSAAEALANQARGLRMLYDDWVTLENLVIWYCYEYGIWQGMTSPVGPNAGEDHTWTNIMVNHISTGHAVRIEVGGAFNIRRLRIGTTHDNCIPLYLETVNNSRITDFRFGPTQTGISAVHVVDCHDTVLERINHGNLPNGNVIWLNGTDSTNPCGPIHIKDARCGFPIDIDGHCRNIKLTNIDFAQNWLGGVNPCIQIERDCEDITIDRNCSFPNSFAADVQDLGIRTKRFPLTVLKGLFDDWNDNRLTNRVQGMAFYGDEGIQGRPEWTTTVGTPAVANGVLNLPAGSVVNQEVRAACEMFVGTWRFRWDFAGVITAGSLQFRFMYQDANNYWYLLIHSNGTHDVRKVEGGVITPVVNGAWVVDGNEHYTVITRTKNGNWSQYLDGVQLGLTTQDVFLPTPTYVFFRNLADQAVTIDNMVIY